MPIGPVVGVGKDGRTVIDWSMGLPEQEAPVYRATFENCWPCAGRFSVANAIGTQLRGLINSALARWRMTVLMETVAESGKGGVESRKYAPDSAWVWRMSRLTRDGTAEPYSRDQTLRRERGQGKSYFPCSADHEQDWQPYPVDAQSAKSDDHTHTHTTKP